MGCLKLTYYPETEPRINMFSEELTTKISVQNAYSSYLFGFNGKELDNEIQGDGNAYDFGARIYDSRLGRWLSLDPLMAKYPDLSPYNFCANNPIYYIDIDGKEVYIHISDKPVGVTKIRLIGEEDVKNAPETVTVPIYQMTVTDDVTGKITTYLVTRDAPIIDENKPTNTDGTFNVKNIAFEPKEDVGKYKGIALDYPVGMTAIALRNPDDSKELQAVPNDSPFRKDQNIAKGVMIHVGGEYVDAQGESRVTGSEGCFTIVGGNEGIENFEKDIVNRKSANIKAGKGSKINIEVEKRDNVIWNADVDSKGDYQNFEKDED